MSNAPVTEIDLADFAADPYPDLARMRAEAPITYVPQLGATLLTRRDDIHQQEKRIEVFSSLQPDGLMTQLMGENMMRKDGADHQAERRILFRRSALERFRSTGNRFSNDPPGRCWTIWRPGVTAILCGIMRCRFRQRR